MLPESRCAVRTGLVPPADDVLGGSGTCSGPAPVRLEPVGLLDRLLARSSGHSRGAPRSPDLVTQAHFRSGSWSPLQLSTPASAAERVERPDPEVAAVAGRDGSSTGGDRPVRRARTPADCVPDACSTSSSRGGRQSLRWI